jgi:hypothetical protein
MPEIRMKSQYILDAQLNFGSPGTITSAYASGAFDLDLGNTAMQTDLLQPILAQNQASKVFNAIIALTACKVSAGNESYGIKVQHSPDGVNWQDCSRTANIGPGATNPIDPSTPPCNVVLVCQVQYEFVQLVVTPSGTSPSITLGECFFTPLTNSRH